MVEPGRPSFCTGVRGMLYRRVRVRTAAVDAHSGLYGGAALNAAHALWRSSPPSCPGTAGSLRRCTPGSPPPAPRRSPPGTTSPGDEALAAAGLRPADPGAADGFYMRTLASPSLDVHGLACGEPWAVKTSIPCEAAATLSLRLAGGQDADGFGEVLDDLLRSAAPRARVTIEGLGLALPAVLDPGHPSWPRPRRDGGGNRVAPGAGAERGDAARRRRPGREGHPHGPHRLRAARRRDPRPDEHLRVEHLELGTRAGMEILRALGRLAD